ncbi:hypothetical protein CC86DRAFT_189089 [Ophiobolus disseminans]|uniref:Uncharacterized protein n=1 Tax=Ophiobolus disseminans TaxID=1469910 RepID=A0A6A7A9Q0_9PLEO|nr:hypothetical protein CC86DRAFT_189089 [Ophiobolus disseminans]
MTIFAKSPKVAPSAFNYACRTGWLAHTVYRELAATTTSSSSLPSSTITPGISMPTATPSSTSVSIASTPTASSSPPGDQASKAWIAGAVIGPLVGVSLIGALVFWWRRRGKGRPAHPHEVGPPDYASGEHNLVEKYTHELRPVEMEGPHPPIELSAPQKPLEMPVSRY